MFSIKDNFKQSSKLMVVCSSWPKRFHKILPLFIGLLMYLLVLSGKTLKLSFPCSLVIVMLVKVGGKSFHMLLLFL